MFYIVSTCFSIYHVSIISAIFSHKVSELNSKSFLLSGGTLISSNSDMNNYTEIGNYYANSEIAQSLQNAPFNHSFTMKIDYGNGTGYICQTYREIDTGRIAIRYNSQQVANADQWQPYVYFSDDDTVLQAAQHVRLQQDSLPDETTTNSFLDNYSASFQINTHYYICISLGFAHSVLGGGSLLIEGQKTSDQWEWQKSTKYNTINGIEIKVRTKGSGTWGEWKLIV